VGLLDYDWRRESDHPLGCEPQPSARPAEDVRIQDTLCPSVPVPSSSMASRSDMEPALVPSFFRSQLQNVTPGYQRPPTTLPTASIPGIFAATAPPPAPPQSHAQMGVAYDPAANMLSMLESKLSGIKASIRAMPRTGYTHRPRELTGMEQIMQAQPPAPPPVVKEQANTELDLDFLALIEATVAQPPPVAVNVNKRKAEELDAKALDLKERNRQSAKASRERKKARVETLLKQVDELMTQNLDLAQTCKDIAEENDKIRQELKEFGHKFDEDSEDSKAGITSTVIFCTDVICLSCCIIARQWD